MNRKLDLQQPNKFEDWRENDEPTSDLYRLTGVSRGNKLRKPEEYRGSADLRWRRPEPENYEAERRRRRLVKDKIAQMLDGYKWDWFSTYTVNIQAKPDTVHEMFRRDWLHGQIPRGEAISRKSRGSAFCLVVILRQGAMRLAKPRVPAACCWRNQRRCETARAPWFELTRLQADTWLFPIRRTHLQPQDGRCRRSPAPSGNEDPSRSQNRAFGEHTPDLAQRLR